MTIRELMYQALEAFIASPDNETWRGVIRAWPHGKCPLSERVFLSCLSCPFYIYTERAKTGTNRYCPYANTGVFDLRDAVGEGTAILIAIQALALLRAREGMNEPNPIP